MKKIVVLGSSPAGVKAVEGIRAFDRESEITIVGFDGNYPYDRNLFPGILANETPYKDVFCKAKKFYEENRIHVVLDQKVTRVNLRKNKITFEDKEQRDYDVLIITDTPTIKLPEVKGNTKNGVFHLKRLKGIERMIDTLPLTDTVVIQSDGWTGLQAAVAFLKRKKDVVLITLGPYLLFKMCSAVVGGTIAQALMSKGLRIICENSIAEILGEADAKAIRLQEGKVMASQMIIFEDAREDLRIFADSSLEINRGICINKHLRSNLENVFAVENVCESNQYPFAPEDLVSAVVLEEQGRIVAASLKGEDASFAMPLVTRSLSFEDLSLDILGQPSSESIAADQMLYDADKKAYAQLYGKGHVCTGAFLVNAREQLFTIVQRINRRAAIEEFTKF
jgi:NAD(P)H-nitrite reductase large subunit